MQSDYYTDQDTERVRHAEYSSVGAPTSPLSSGMTMAPTGTRRNNNLIAVGLVAIGILMFVGRLGIQAADITGGIVLLTIASCFLFFAFWRRIYGLLLPGCILAGLSAGVTFADLTDGVSVLWGLALGFLAIALLGRKLFNVRSSWPVIPAIPLFCIGVIVAAEAAGVFALGLIWLPLLLVGAGLYLGWGRSRI